MKFHTGLLLPLLASSASAISDAKVYVFENDEWSNGADGGPALTPEEARLVFAHRLGVSEYHSLDGASEDTLSYINRFGGRHSRLFEVAPKSKAAELVLFVEGASVQNAGPLAGEWAALESIFTITDPPSSSENLELVLNLDRQLGPETRDCSFEEDINPRNKQCWKGTSKITQIDLASEASGILI